MDNLINEKIAEQQIIKLGIKVTAKDVEEAIEKVKRENNFTHEELIYSLKWEGLTLKEYKEKIKKEIERFRLVNYEVKSKIVITEEDIKKYYHMHTKEYAEVSKVKLARIFVLPRAELAFSVCVSAWISAYWLKGTTSALKFTRDSNSPTAPPCTGCCVVS